MKIRIRKVNEGRIEARGESPDPSMPASGELLGLARKVAGGESWAIRVQGDPAVTFVIGEMAARARLLELVSE